MRGPGADAERFGDSLLHYVVLTVLFFILAPAVGQRKPNEKKIVFEHGRWEAIACVQGGKDCPDRQLSANGPVGTAYSIEKKIDEIQCYRQEGLCVIASAGSTNGFLYTDIQRFFVAKWDEHEVEANWVDSSPAGGGEWEQKLEIAFASSGVDSVILEDSLTKVPQGRGHQGPLGPISTDPRQSMASPLAGHRSAALLARGGDPAATLPFSA